ncbi:MAG: FemAB family PEP-CTERM system-associated protein [Desulfobacterales bacterium]|nr:FemAB family PEP-CTERM system-associated protein [Desulfobacterales bacterium]
MKIKLIDTTDIPAWDKYVEAHRGATLYHLSAWERVIRKTYEHKTYYLMAVKNDNSVAGVLPLVHLKHFIFGNNLVSIPFFDMGGILADDEQTEKEIMARAVEIGKKLGTENIELRHTGPLLCPVDSGMNLSVQVRSHKVRMLLALSESSEILMKSFKSKLRSQIKKPMKESLHSKIGGQEMLDDFYMIFLKNMRDLGSPVHSKKLIKNVLEEFPDKARIVMIYKDSQPLACSLVVGFRETLENPWASSLREYSRLSPNMLLYWTMLEYGCDNGYAFFDFGRSSPDEGTYKFKEQWGAKPNPLHWHYISLSGKPLIENDKDDKSKFDKAIQYWKKLPVPVTKIIGPLVRKHVGL